MQICPDKFESYGRIVHRAPVSDEALFYVVWTDTFSESQLETRLCFLNKIIYRPAVKIMLFKILWMLLECLSWIPVQASNKG